MRELHFWRLCDHLSVVQAALLIVGTDPSGTQEYLDQWEPSNLPRGYSAVFAALKSAVLSGSISSRIRTNARDVAWIEAMHLPDGDQVHFERGGAEAFFMIEPDWQLTMIPTQEIREWLKKRNFPSDFFFPEGLETTDYLNPADDCFSPKLSAAVGAWQAVKNDSSLTRNKSVKTALGIWLNMHAAKYGLTKEDGTPNKQAIEEVSKVANWSTKGGAPKTPGEPDPPF